MEYIQDDRNSVELTPALTSQDEEHLKLLSITGIILGCVTMFFSCFGLIHFFMGLAIALNKFPVDPKSPPPPVFMGWIFVFVGAAIVLTGWLMGGFTIHAARLIAARKNKTLIQVMAGINCVHMPFGTLWGVFVFVVLSRPTVAAAFDKPTTPNSIIS